MLITLVVALVIVGITYRRRSVKLKDKNKSTLYQYRGLIILASIVIIPIVLLNILRPTVWLSDPDEIIEHEEEHGNIFLELKALRFNIVNFPDSVPLYFDYVERYVDYQHYENDAIRARRYSPDLYYHRLCIEYADALCPDFEFADTATNDGRLLPRIDLSDGTRFHHYVQAVYDVNNGDYVSAEENWFHEIAINENFNSSYEWLYTMYKELDRAKFEKFIKDSKYAAHLSVENLTRDYFLMGEYGLFIEIIYKDRFIDISIMALIAGLLISMLWLFFLREMDFFDKERWIDIILVFLGGAVMAHLCLFLYSYARYHLGFGITGEGWNDFWYCTFIIGFGEEIVKLIPWVVFVLLSKRVNEPFDYIFYACASALGFAFAENLMYLEDSSNIVPRAIMSTVGHMFDASLVAYAVVLAKYKFKKRRYKIGIPVLGFALACLSHGFYDFWLISPAFNLGIITILFFILTVHMWLYMINNATNHSQFFSGRLINLDKSADILNYSFVGLIMLQYTFLSYEYGAHFANRSLQYNSWFPVAFLIYIAAVMSQFDAVKGVWHKYKFPVTRLLAGATSLYRPSVSNSDHTGLELKLFAPKTNRFIGSKLPISGVCKRPIKVNGKEGWYLFNLNRSIGMPNYNGHQVIIKPKSTTDELTRDKVEIYLMLIPIEYIRIPDDLPINELRHTGRTYARLGK